jgi:cell division protein FtsB
LEQKRNNIDIARLQREWEEIRKEREQEAKTMAKLVDGLKRATKGMTDSGKLDKLIEYLTEQLRTLREANRN